VQGIGSQPESAVVTAVDVVVTITGSSELGFACGGRGLVGSLFLPGEVPSKLLEPILHRRVVFTSGGVSELV
jgi:hypothetical protein